MNTAVANGQAANGDWTRLGIGRDWGGDGGRWGEKGVNGVNGGRTGGERGRIGGRVDG